MKTLSLLDQSTVSGGQSLRNLNKCEIGGATCLAAAVGVAALVGFSGGLAAGALLFVATDAAFINCVYSIGERRCLG